MEFWTFFVFIIPSLFSFVVPAAVMYFAVPMGQPDTIDDQVVMKRGAHRIMTLFLFTIATVVSFHNFHGLPPVVRMLTGLAYLQFFGYYLKKTEHIDSGVAEGRLGDVVPFDIFNKVARGLSGIPCYFFMVWCCVSVIWILWVISDLLQK